jgi:cell division transport system ATP-binding protein
MLKFDSVTYQIKDEVILSDLNFTIYPGEIVAILGVSGAGKSSVFHLLTGEKRISSGDILLDNFSLKKLSASSLQKYRRQIGIIFQDFRLLPNKTVYENVAYALEVTGQEEKIAIKVPELLELVGLSDKAKNFPKELSGGEKQRTAIARALVHDPKILIADEATGNLDPKNSRLVGQLLKKINQEKDVTVIFSTHDPIVVKELTPRVIRLEAGKVLFDKTECSVLEAFTGVM